VTKRSIAPPNVPEQWDLFGERGSEYGGTASEEPGIDPQALDDQELIELVPKANLSNIHALCSQITARNLKDAAVPGLVALWCRFKGFGIARALPEQRLALQTLGEIGTPVAKAAISKILAADDLPDSLLPIVLQAATTVTLSLPLGQITRWLEHDFPIVRALAFTLIQTANPPVHILETGLTDPDTSVRRAALVTTGNLGHHIAKPGLLAEFSKNPTGQIVRALLAIADEEIIVRVGRFAEENQSLQGFIVSELTSMDDLKATKIAQRIKNQMTQR